MTSPDDPPATFREKSTHFFKVFVVVMALLGLGILALGWWLGGWWGLAGGAVVATVVVAGGLIGGTLIYAMTQDSA